MKNFLVLLASLVVAGCVTTSAFTNTSLTAPDPEQVPALQAKLTSDLTAAIERANAATDPMAPVRANCYQTILSYVPNLPQFNAPRGGPKAGVFDAFEAQAEVAEGLHTVTEFQIPTEVRVKLLTQCGPVVAAGKDLLARFGLRIVRVGGVIGILP